MATQPPSGLPQISSGLKMWASEIWTNIRSQDIDAVLSFDTPSVIRVRDRYLGAIYHSLNLIIFIYIVVYQIIIRQGYLLTESPQGGNIRVDINPLKNNNSNSLTYCENPGYKCIYSSLGLNTDQSLPFIPTSYSVQKVPFIFPGCKDLSTMAQSSDCMYPNDKHEIQEDKYFLSRAEDYGITITHTVAGLLSQFTESSDKMTGQLNAMDDRLIQTFEKGQTSDHVIPIRKLLEAAGVEMDPQTGLLADEDRKQGIFLLVYIKYNPLNHRGALRFEMTVNKLEGESSRPLQTYFANPFPEFINGNKQSDSGLNYTVVKMNGITLQVRQVGKIGTFNLQTLLINLVAGSALLRLATFLVELLMIRFMPQREVYCKYKYHETLDFGDYRKAQRRGCEAHNMAVQKPAFHNEFPVLEYPTQENDNHYPSSSNPNAS